MKFCILLTVFVLVGIFYIQVDAEALIDCFKNRAKSGDYCKGLGLDAEPCKIHECMTSEQVQEIFQTTHDAVPDYEVVQFDVSRLVKRGARTVRALRVNAFGGDLKLWLQPAEGILAGKNTPVLIAKKHTNGRIIYEDYPNGMKNVGKLLEDPAQKASMIVGKDSKGLYSVSGHIASKNLVVKPLPQSVSDDLAKNRASKKVVSKKSKTTRSAYHVIFKREPKRNEEINKSVKWMNETRTRLSRSPTIPVPDVVYPEIMVVVDSSLYALNGNNVDKVLAYAVTFWNGVDLLYRSFEGPKFRFNIVRVIVAKEPNAVPYISKNMVNPTIFNAYHAIEDAARFYFALLNKFPDDSYDTVVTLSRLYMGDGGVDPDILGLMPERGGACVVDRKRKLVMKVAIISDSGSFDGVSTAAHEFGHLLGADHDESMACRPTDGYIMSSVSEITENSHDFSVCTVEDIQEWLNNDGGTCLYNVPKTKDPLPRLLPGQMRDRDYQCKMSERGNSCYDEGKNQLPCTAIYCYDPKDSSKCLRVIENAPADGAFCATGKICLHGQCVKI